MVSMTDVRVVKEKLMNTTVFYKEYDLGHMSFFVAKDMAYFKEDVMGLLSKYNPVTIQIE